MKLALIGQFSATGDNSISSACSAALRTTNSSLCGIMECQPEVKLHRIQVNTSRAQRP